ncbi:MAG: hypothetical protein K1X94_11080 [Sandaracinaceae bacterium]|nr:hypothetical protein [Sandaracinaceae bacterium]
MHTRVVRWVAVGLLTGATIAACDGIDAGIDANAPDMDATADARADATTADAALDAPPANHDVGAEDASVDASAEDASRDAGAEDAGASAGDASASDAGLDASATFDASASDAGLDASATFDASASDAGLDASATFDASASDAGVDASATFDASASDAGLDASATFDASASDAGLDASATFDASASDAGVDASATFDASTDLAPPETALTAGPPSVSSSASAHFTFASDSPGTFQCSLDGAAFAPCSTPLDLAGLGDGLHTFRVAAVDEAGNVDPTPSMWSWFVDTVSPTIAISAPPAEGSTTSSTSANFILSSSEPATLCWSLDGGPPTCSAADSTMLGASLSGLPFGPHTLTVTATDRALNRTTQTRSWRIE